MDAHYEPLPSMPEDGGELGGEGGPTGGLPGSGGGAPGPPDALLSSEQWQWEAIPNLDQFFTRIYRYWEEKGFAVMLTSRVLNLLALAFTGAMSALLLLYVKWGALQDECLKRDTCDIWEVAIRHHPLAGRWSLWTASAAAYLALFSAYWLAALAHLVYEVRDLAEIKHFCNQKLGLSERQMGTATWPEVARRLVQVQGSYRLCAARDLNEHDIVSRVMRRENYLIGMLNKGVLALSIPLPGFRRHFLLTKTLEWNIYWCVLDAMFDERSFRLKPAFLHNERALRKRLRAMALLNLAAAPFLLVFLLIYFFMKNAEKFYHHPSSVGARRWSPLAQWRLRELNELPHFIKHRLNASHKAAEAYIQQFPSLVLSHTARFVAFVAGSTAALLLCVTFIDERLLERDLFGRQLVWWVAVVGVVVALSRAFVIETGTAFDPEAALIEVVAHTHYLPRHWQGRAHTGEVRQEFEALFQFKALLFLEELASILLTPLLLWFSLPQCAGAVLSFVEDNTTHVEGVGDVCSLATFDFQRHGNTRYGSPSEAPKARRSRQGKMERSFVSFAATYPEWEPDAAGQHLLGQLAETPAAAALAASLMQQQQQQGQQPLALSVLLAQRQQGHLGPGLLSRGLPVGIGLRRRQGAALASLLLGGGSMAAGLQYGGGTGDSLFGSAELAADDVALAGAGGTAGTAARSMGGPVRLAASMALPAGRSGDPQADQVATSQLLLQSLYEQRRWQPAQQHAQHAQQTQQAQQWARQAAGSASLSPPGGVQQQQQHPAAAAAVPIPQWHAAPADGVAQQAAASASPLQHRPFPASPSLHHQQQQQQQQQTLGSSPRQAWQSRSPPGRARISEQQLSVLSRGHSTLSREHSSAEAEPVAAAVAAAAAAGGSGSWREHDPHATHSPAHAHFLLPPEEEEQASQSLLQQQLLLLGHSHHGSQMPLAADEAGGSPAGSDGPPQFF